MKTYRIVLCLMVFTGLMMIVTLSGIDDSSCYAQVTTRIAKKLNAIKDTTLDKENNKSRVRVGEMWDLTQATMTEDERDAASEIMIDLLENDPNGRVRAAAALIICNFRNEKAVISLKKALDDKDIEVRVNACNALVNYGKGEDKKVYTMLQDFARGTESEKWDVSVMFSQTTNAEYIKKQYKLKIRANAVNAIGNVITPETKALLEALTKDPERSIRIAANKQLEKNFIK